MTPDRHRGRASTLFQRLATWAPWIEAVGFLTFITSIPGAGTVNLDPLFDRSHRLAEIEVQRASLLSRIDALPPHPWGKTRT